MMSRCRLALVGALLLLPNIAVAEEPVETALREKVAAIDALPARARPQAAGTLFRLIHPVADSGDEVAAGPAMELVIAYQPSNFMAVYHAGMSAHKNGRVERARTLLRRFLTMYNNSNDGWRSRAQRALAEIAARSK